MTEPINKIRRRYWCATCGVPFTSYESIELGDDERRVSFKKQVAVAIKLIQSAAAERLG